MKSKDNKINITQEQLEELALEKRREYQRNWRAKNKDKVKMYNETYWKNQVKEEIREIEASRNK